MKTPVAPQQYIIQIDLASEEQVSASSSAGAQVDIKELQRLLGEAGIKLDANYRPICVNSKQKRFVVRGRATQEARLRAERKLGNGVRFFSDGPVQAMNVRQRSR
jgi:hypothetical protein